MTARYPDKTKQKRRQRFELPDPPQREPEDMTSFDHLTINGNAHYLGHHLGNPDTTIISGERYITRAPRAPASQRMAPDLLVAFNAAPEAFKASNGYIISEQGKPPNLVMEIASRRTGGYDVGPKRIRYAALSIPEYWRFDETGAFHGTLLAGDQLVDDEYRPIPIETLVEGTLQGYSPVLNLFLRWHNGQLQWIDPGTGRQIVTLEESLARADAAQARVRELEAELARRDMEG